MSRYSGECIVEKLSHTDSTTISVAEARPLKACLSKNRNQGFGKSVCILQLHRMTLLSSDCRNAQSDKPGAAGGNKLYAHALQVVGTRPLLIVDYRLEKGQADR